MWAARAVFERRPLRTLQIPVSSLHVASSWSATTEPSPFNFLRSVSYSSSLRIGFPIRYRLLAIMNLISSFEKSCASGREGGAERQARGVREACSALAHRHAARRELEIELELLVVVLAEQLLPALVVVRVEAVEVQLLLFLEPDCRRRASVSDGAELQRNCAAGRRGAHSASRSPSRGRPP